MSHEGAAGTLRDVKLSPLPVQQPLEVWLGGTVPAALERCGRLSDGWLPSLCTPDGGGGGARRDRGRRRRSAGRSISGEHFGMSIGYARDADRSGHRAHDGRAASPLARADAGGAARRCVSCSSSFIAVGFSKFVVRPVVTPRSWRAELEALAGGGRRPPDLSMIRAVDIKAELAGLAGPAGARTSTPAEEVQAAFAVLAPFRDGSIFAGRFSGDTPWERHRKGDELVQVLDGAATLTIMTDEGPRSFELRAGMLIVVPQGHWHRFEAPDGVTVLSATPQPTDHTAAADPRGEA